MITVSESAVIDARPEEIYAIISEYRVHHQAIIPRAYFKEMTVEKGGQGAGTEIFLRMRVLGVEKTYYQYVTEPEPGRVLMEADPKAGVVTTFTVEPMDGGQHARVTISTESKPSPGFAGFMEKLIQPPISRRIYRQELQQLADYARRLRAN